jgi:CBS domain containing-hemolysin-like protein
MTPDPSADALTFAWRLALTFSLVFANGFFVAAEFALVKIRSTQLHSLVESGSLRARAAQQIHRRLDHYLSACQLGITLSSLILGWLAEPAVAQLLVAGAAAASLPLSPGDPLVHGVALALAFAVVTFLHMTLGEQAPKIWAITRTESTVLQVAHPLRLFGALFRPFIALINGASNLLLRAAGVSPAELGESSHSVDELRSILTTSAQAGHISKRQLELAENVFGIMGLEVRHIMVPRVDAQILTLQSTPEENLSIIRESGHSRFPLCRVGLDTVIGFVHAKDVLRASANGAVDLQSLARRPIFAPDTQPLSRLIARMQSARSHCVVVVDEHGTAVGLAFLEDALEEIVGPIRDEFDEAETEIEVDEQGALELPGTLALPEAEAILDLPGLGDASDTIGGVVVARLGRLPRKGDELDLGAYRVRVEEVTRRRIVRLRFERLHVADEDAEPSPSKLLDAEVDAD